MEIQKMDTEQLVEAARTGNVTILQKLLHENPFIFADAALLSSSSSSSDQQSFLHIATKAGKLEFVRELIKHDPRAARELNTDGLRAMDIASAMGNVEIVKELLTVGSEICRLKGRDRRTALHYAAVKGRVEVIDELVSTCPECIEDVTACSETALHLAVKNYQFDAFSALVRWLERLSLQEPIINWGDGDGNTVLHLAAARKQVESIELLLGKSNAISGKVEVNATNQKGLTALDLLQIVNEISPIDTRLTEILRRAGALVARDICVIPSASSPDQDQDKKALPTSSELDLNQSQEPSKDWIGYFKFQASRDSPSDVRSALLVVAALIATVTFQAGVNPPEVVFQKNGEPHTYKAFVFSFFNSLGLSASVNIIEYLTGGFPFQRELRVSMFCLMFTYGFLIGGLTPKQVAINLLIVFAFFLPYILRFSIPRGIKALKRRRSHRQLSGGNPALSV